MCLVIPAGNLAKPSPEPTIGANRMSASARVPVDESGVAVLPQSAAGPLLDQKMSKSPGNWGMLIFGVVLLAGLAYAGSQLAHDLSTTHLLSAWPYILLGVALLIALGFEFVNGFHDTANAVAT